MAGLRAKAAQIERVQEGREAMAFSFKRAFSGQYEDRQFIVPETAAYLNDESLVDLAYFNGKPIRLQVGSHGKKYGIMHLLGNAAESTGRTFDNVTNDDAENAALGVIDLLKRKDLREHNDGSLVLRSLLAKRAVVLNDVGDFYTVTTVRPAVDNKWGDGARIAAGRLTFPADAELGAATSEMGRTGDKGQAPAPNGREVISTKFNPSAVGVKRQAEVTTKKRRIIVRGGDNKFSKLKSATENNGDFDGANPDIRYSRAPAQQPQPAPLPEETKARKAQRLGQDKFNRFTVIKDWLAEQGVALSEQADVYKAEERMHSRFANQVEDFRNKLVEPLIKKIQAAGFSMDDVSMFLHAQHAEERNNQIAKINPTVADGSGMSTADANNVLAAAPAELRALANEFRQITEMTKQTLLTSGIISQDMVDAWEGAYSNYIPLKGGPDGAKAGTGKGLHVNGKMKRALGHGKREGGEWIVENILADYERAVMLSEKNRVGQHLIKMALEVGRDDLIALNKPEKRSVLRNSHAYEVRYHGSLVAVFDSENAAKTFKTTMGRAGRVATSTDQHSSEHNAAFAAFTGFRQFG